MGNQMLHFWCKFTRQSRVFFIRSALGMFEFEGTRTRPPLSFLSPSHFFVWTCFSDILQSSLSLVITEKSLSVTSSWCKPWPNNSSILAEPMMQLLRNYHRLQRAQNFWRHNWHQPSNNIFCGTSKSSRSSAWRRWALRLKPGKAPLKLLLKTTGSLSFVSLNNVIMFSELQLFSSYRHKLNFPGNRRLQNGF